VKNRAGMLIALIAAFAIPILMIFLEWIEVRDCLSYFGAFVGGIITLIGVIITIDNNNEINRESQNTIDERNQYNLKMEKLPILKFEITNNENMIIGESLSVGEATDSDGDIIFRCLKVKVAGVNPVRNLSFDYSIDNTNYRKEECYILRNPFLVQGDEVRVPMSINVPKILDGADLSNYYIYVRCNYLDIIGTEYCQVVRCVIAVNHVVNNDAVLDKQYVMKIDRIEGISELVLEYKS